MEKIKVVKNEVNPEPIEIIADSIIRVSEAAQRLLSSKLTEKAIICLLWDCIPIQGYQNKKVSRSDIKLVLEYAAKLKDIYIKKSKEFKR